MINKILKPSNWKKTYYYIKKNGFKAAVMAALERLQKSENDSYQYVPPTEEELTKQRELSSNGEILFSILVPVYRTPEKYFREMIQSVLDQSYPHWELLLGDASPEPTPAVSPNANSDANQASNAGTVTSLQAIVNEINDTRVKYIKIAENKGISANTNVVLEKAAGQYIGLLDHDDILTPDALFCMYEAIKQSAEKGICAKMLYSDEDKGDGEMQYFYDLNAKPAFDQDYLWSNNYICHFTVMEAELMKKLGFRKEFDGAQDFDIILRAAREIEKERKIASINSQVVNISRVLYHWRCHMDSTAVNPQSKLYAYEAGKRAVEEDLQVRGIEVKVSHSKHLGFYQVSFADIFKDRPEVAMVAGPVYKQGRIAGGARRESGELLYGGLRKGFSGGHLHRASVWQQCFAADFGQAVVRRDLFLNFLQSREPDTGEDAKAVLHAVSEWTDKTLENCADVPVKSGIEAASVPYGEERLMNSSCLEAVMQPQEVLKHLTEEQRDRLCMAWANYVHARGMIILYNPEME